MASPFSSAPLNSVSSPFGAPMFKVAPGESAAPQSASSSPFAAGGAATTNQPLTVGDVLPQLPPDVARAAALPPDQPVAISSQVLDEALRSGQAAVPIFEIYRVCPALFQTPVSPQDPRLIPLPSSKLPRLIAAAQAAGAGPTAPSAPAASPFSTTSPFSTAPTGGNSIPEDSFSAPGAISLPPRRTSSLPSFADLGAPKAEPPAISPPGAPVFPVSPFAAAGAEVAAPQASPFSVQPSAPQGMSSAEKPLAASPCSLGGSTSSNSPFSTASESGASPFPAAPSSPATPSFNSPGGASPFGTAQGVSSPAPGTPFGSLFGDKAVPTGQPAPDSLSARSAGGFQPPSSSPAHSAPGFQSSASASSAPVKVSLATLLKGYTMAELGFDPMVVPAWITTALPAGTVNEFLTSPAPLAQLGLLIDCVTDVGFRNVLNNARRDFQLRVDAEMLRNALTGQSAAPTLPNLASLGQATPPANSGGMPGLMRVEPPQGMSSPASGKPPLADFGTPPSPFAEAKPSAFTQPAPAAGPFGPASAAPAQAFGASPSLQPTIFPGHSAGPQQPPRDPFAPQMPPAAPVLNAPTPQTSLPAWTSQPAQGSPPPFSSSSPFSAPIEEPSFQPAEPSPAFSSSLTPVPDPALTGFSSDQLLGRLAESGPESRAAWNQAAAAAASGPLPLEPLAENRQPPVIDLPPASASGFFAPPEDAPARATRPFVPPAFIEDDAPAFPPAKPAPTSARNPSLGSATTAASSIGVQTHDANPDQIMLRALLDTDSDLTPQRVVELTCALPGIAACVCLSQGRSFSHIGAHKPQAREFQRQATQLAEHLRTLAPLIGIDGAETFTMNSGDRLMTFCFPEGAILGVLHDAEPTLGLRDKVTLIARELARMLA